MNRSAISISYADRPVRIAGGHTEQIHRGNLDRRCRGQRIRGSIGWIRAGITANIGERDASDVSTALVE